VVPLSHINVSNYKREVLNDGLAGRGSGRLVSDDNKKTIKQFLSMGHRLQVLTYDPDADIVEVTRYDSRSAQNNASTDTFKYRYHGYCEETRQYSPMVQTFAKYNEPYNWSKVDRIICGDEDRELREGMRARRIMFAILPDRFSNAAAEKEHIAKFMRLLEYFNRIREKTDTEQNLNVKIVSNYGGINDETDKTNSTPGISRESMKRFYVQLRKGKKELFDWLEVVIDSTFDTAWSYRIMFNWLLASSGKVDMQLQQIQRRCTQFGLKVVAFPQVSVSSNLLLNPFKSPVIYSILEPVRAATLLKEMAQLAQLDFVHDGVFSTDARTLMECTNTKEDFDFGGPRSNLALGRQFVHRSGTLFVRCIADRKGKALVVAFGNFRYIGKDQKLRRQLEDVFKILDAHINHDIQPA
jgi:hypothetical protein